MNFGENLGWNWVEQMLCLCLMMWWGFIGECVMMMVFLGGCSIDCMCSMWVGNFEGSMFSNLFWWQYFSVFMCMVLVVWLVGLQLILLLKVWVSSWWLQQMLNMGVLSLVVLWIYLVVCLFQFFLLVIMVGELVMKIVWQLCGQDGCWFLQMVMILILVWYRLVVQFIWLV